MKSTGIIRRIDELGRIVVPKEIRNSLEINSTDNIEIYVENDSIILKKYSLVKSIDNFSEILVNVISKKLDRLVVITDREKVISCSSKTKTKLLNRKISDELQKIIKREENIYEKYKKTLKIINEEIDCTYIIQTIRNTNGVIGLFIMYDENKNLDDKHFLVCSLISEFLGKYLEK